MIGQRSLSGKCVLVVEDDYYLAADEVSLLTEAGATVVGCTGDPEEAANLIGNQHIDFALVDINLGQGPAFDTARALNKHNIPFLFTTGYDPESIPVEFRDNPRLGKPFGNQMLLSMIEQII